MPESTRPRIGALALILLLVPASVLGHGGVVRENDLCVIKVGYLEAHFKIYQPRSRQHQEFCEDLPDVGETVFVMEYLHSGFSDAPLDFRVVRNVTGLGRFTRWEDVSAIGDLEPITIFHRAAELSPDVFSAVVDFDAPGDYLGIVTARHPDATKTYYAVFPFRVGFNGFGFWPWLALLIGYVLVSGWMALGKPLWRPPFRLSGQSF